MELTESPSNSQAGMNKQPNTVALEYNHRASNDCSGVHTGKSQWLVQKESTGRKVDSLMLTDPDQQTKTYYLT